jgi:hypothetical protein
MNLKDAFQDPSLQYAFIVTGAGTLFVIAWWVFCFTVRNGIDGLRAMSKAIAEKRKLDVRKIFLGDWK